MVDRTAVSAASAALVGLASIAVFTAWILSLNRVARFESAPARLALLFLRIALPLYALGFLLLAVSWALQAAWNADVLSYVGIEAALYVNSVGAMLFYAGAIGVTMVLYMATIAGYYVAQGRAVLWRLFQVDAPVGGALLLIFDIAYFARYMVVQSDSRAVYTPSLIWLLIIIDLTLLLLTVGVFGTMIFVISKLKSRGGPAAALMGNVPTLIIVASSLWAVRCAYAVATNIQTWQNQYYDSYYEYNNTARLIRPILYAIFETWFGAVAAVLLAVAFRHLVWADSTIHPTSNSFGGQQQQQPPVGYYPAPPPGQQVPMGGVYYQSGPNPGQGGPPPPMYMYSGPQPGMMQQQQQGQQQHPIYYTPGPGQQQPQELQGQATEGYNPVQHVK